MLEYFGNIFSVRMARSSRDHHFFVRMEPAMSMEILISHKMKDDCELDSELDSEMGEPPPQSTPTEYPHRALPHRVLL